MLSIINCRTKFEKYLKNVANKIRKNAKRVLRKSKKKYNFKNSINVMSLLQDFLL